MGKRVLVVSTATPEESALREALSDADEIRVVAPAADVSWLDWLTNAEDDARAEAREAAERTAGAVAGDATVEVDMTSQNTDAAANDEDALRTFDADEIVLVTRPGGDAAWAEDDATRKALEAHGRPVRRLEVR